MKRINVIGTTGSGKSTFSKALAEKLGVPYLEMDKIFWKPNWQEPSDAEFFEKLEQAIQAEAWVLDGNYTRTTGIKWARADTVIWLDYGRFTTLFQLIRRSVTRAIKKQELWPDTNNRESFAKLFSKKSILVWFVKCYSLNRKRYPQLMSNQDYPHIQFVRLTSPKQAENFLRCL